MHARWAAACAAGSVVASAAACGRAPRAERPAPTTAESVPAAAAAPGADSAAERRADGYEDCAIGGFPALDVRLVDAATGRALTYGRAFSAWVEWWAGRSHGYGRWLPNYGPGGHGPPLDVPADGLVIPAAYGRPGTYDLVVRAPGYRPAAVRGVRVPEVPGRYHVVIAPAHCVVGDPVVVEVRLAPELGPARGRAP